MSGAECDLTWSLSMLDNDSGSGGLRDAATGLVQSTPAPRVEMRAQDDLYAAVIEVDLVSFDDADFVELTQRATSMGLSHLRMATTVAGTCSPRWCRWRPRSSPRRSCNRCWLR
ncbi:MULTISPECIES: hypothetical protein [Pseudonocardia]|uniref:Uncharacterized protein n=2 Tax=Pseudonocardia TaxID=1847 RepID=A0A1Y2MZM4_PSEAH|nr:MULTISPECIES: hypothetical protein [Pseudonocardia]OSY40625.1 hypothetical protein BG845_02702 [Pseudonocardia autotrophica]TDN73577.1 hypothetical protein C8E95_2681 [Pseudonocardia autotrophica]BBG04322.1 hypothetical protein Pdca_55310 [Pseudonocardia autotrophica]GEC25185.1 hypothetical protein PSA01_22140 [Pseudonocardia saturnea]